MKNKKLTFLTVIELAQEFADKKNIKIEFNNSEVVDCMGRNAAACSNVVMVAPNYAYDSAEIMAVCIAHEFSHLLDKKHRETVFEREFAAWGETMGLFRKIFKTSPSMRAAKFAVGCIKTYANKVECL